MVKVKVNDVGGDPEGVDLLVESDLDAESATRVEPSFFFISRSSEYFSSMRMSLKVNKFGILL